MARLTRTQGEAAPPPLPLAGKGRGGGLAAPAKSAPTLAALASLCLALAGCASSGEADPVAWWHEMQGGEIAKQRPPPPGAEDPYPNLATVPAKPAAPDPKLRQQVADALVADRVAAQRAAAAEPLPAPAAAPAKPAPPPAQPADPNAATASLAAASAPAPAPAPKLAAPAAAPPAADADQASFGNLPPLPSGPPPQANLPGLDAASVAPPAQVAAAAAPPAAPPSAASGSAPIGFLAGSSALTPSGMDRLRALAASRGTSSVSLTGYGEAATSGPDAQSAALTLGLARAEAMAAALASSGVPAAAVRMDAEAAGRGGAARLLN